MTETGDTKRIIKVIINTSKNINNNKQTSNISCITSVIDIYYCINEKGEI